HLLQIADRAYILENGSIVLEGAAEEVFNNERAKVAYLGL
nr:ABC transporter ATP-binding protein [Dehalococcoidia bacterium]